MKQTLLIITALMLIVGCSETVTTVTEVIEYHSSKDWSPKKIRVYDISGDKIVLTYKEIEFYRNGQKKSEGAFKDGLQDGIWTYWDENGQKWTEWTEWDEDGNVTHHKKY
jgi:antitoxin component YwqK of YwqJK toxin-antitoxin module